MVTKIYRSRTGVRYTFLVKKGENHVSVSFRGSTREYVTSDAELQNAIEGTKYFKEKKIVVVELAESKGEDKNSPTDYNDVSDINGAVAILSGEPYNVSKAKLRTPDAVRKAAKENDVSFPNLIV